MSSRDYQFLFSPRGAAGSARALGAWGREFEPLRGDQFQFDGACGAVVALRAVNPVVVGSIPTTHPNPLARLAEPADAAASKAVAARHAGSSPASGTKNHPLVAE